MEHDTSSLMTAWERDKPYAVAVDTETTGVTFFDVPFLASFWWDDNGYAVDLASKEGQDACRRVLAGTPALLFHNAKFDIQKLQLVELWPRRSGVRDVSEYAVRNCPAGIHDTECVVHLLDEHRPKRLKQLAKDVLKLDTDEAETLRSARRKLGLKKQDGYDQLYEKDPELVIRYAIKDVEFTWKLFWTVWPQLAKYEDLMELYELEQELMWVLLDMETAGMAVDLDYVEQEAKEYGSQVVRAQWKIEDATGRRVFKPEKSGQKTPDGFINPNSPAQLADYFQSKGIEAESYDKHVLKTLEDPLAEAILELRAASKVHGTYLMPMLNEQQEGVLHPNFRQHGTRGRRMSSGEAEE